MIQNGRKQKSLTTILSAILLAILSAGLVYGSGVFRNSMLPEEETDREIHIAELAEESPTASSLSADETTDGIEPLPAVESDTSFTETTPVVSAEETDSVSLQQEIVNVEETVIYESSSTIESVEHEIFDNEETAIYEVRNEIEYVELEEQILEEQILEEQIIQEEYSNAAESVQHEEEGILEEPIYMDSTFMEDVVILKPARTVNAPYGFRYILQQEQEEFHNGIDFSGTCGEAIESASDGVVVYADYDRAYGNMLIIKTGNYEICYAHMESFADGLQVGDFVTLGQCIGTIGRTGAVTGPHLHFEVRLNGAPIDPASVWTE